MYISKYKEIFLIKFISSLTFTYEFTVLILCNDHALSYYSIFIYYVYSITNIEFKSKIIV